MLNSLNPFHRGAGSTGAIQEQCFVEGELEEWEVSCELLFRLPTQGSIISFETQGFIISFQTEGSIL